MIAGPDAAGGAVLGDLLEEVVVGVEEEGEARGEVVDVDARVDAGLDVGDAVGQGEGQFLHGGGAGLADVVAADGDGVPAGHLGRAEPMVSTMRRIDGRGREDPGLLGDVLLEDVVLDGAAELVPGHALLLGHGEVHGREDGGGAVDGHGGGDLVEGDAVEEDLHVLQGVDGDAAPADLARGQGVVGVVAHEGGQVEGDRQPGLAAAPGGTCSAGWCPRRCRSRRTGAWSRGARGTCWAGRRG